MKFIKTFVALLLAASVAFTVLVGADKIGSDVIVKTENPEKKIITIWQIDSFEGGSGSRRQFLLDVARSFEKKNKEVLVTVVSHTINGAETAMQEGVFPDLISYGNGLEIGGVSELSADKKSASGAIGEEQFAAVWCRGVYLSIENPDCKKQYLSETVVSQAEYTLPLAAIVLNGETVENFCTASPMNAYVKFVEGKAKRLIGTQRDAVRLKNRGFNAKITPIISFSDLNQYISVTSTTAEKAVFAERFINYLLSDEIQKTLYKINMFSPYVDVEYDDETFAEISRAEIKSTVSAFLSKKELADLRADAASAAQGDAESLDKIKKVLL